jgi:hypothetical protein
MNELIQVEISLRHIIGIQKVAKAQETSLCIALEKVSDHAAYLFLVTSDY